MPRIKLIQVSDSGYDAEQAVAGDLMGWVDVTDEEYSALWAYGRQLWGNSHVVIVTDRTSGLPRDLAKLRELLAAAKVKAEQERRAREARKAKAKVATKARKLAQLEKLQRELGLKQPHGGNGNGTNS